MFKQAKSAFIWYHLYKFRRTLSLVAVLMFIVLFSQWIYSDVVEYLRLREKLEYLDLILPLKWAIIFFNIGLSVYLVLSLFRGDKSVKKEDIRQNFKKEKSQINEDKFTHREKMFLHKKTLNTKADSIIRDKKTE